MISAKEVAAIAAKALDSKLGKDISLIEIADVSTLADYFLICTATSNTHEPLLNREGHRGGTWVLMDFGCVVVHVFTAETRSFYDLERLWQDGKVVNLSSILTHDA